MERREFLRNAGLVATWAGVAITLGGCGDDDDPAAPAGTGDVSGAIGTNHGHTVTITGAQLDAGAAVTLTLTTGNGHTHTVALDAAQVGDVAGGTTVATVSATSAGHTHTVTFN
ncbi:hypothetical protein KDM41_13090 [bacterium]|nr:hypothetical protein [bacterium]